MAPAIPRPSLPKIPRPLSFRRRRSSKEILGVGVGDGDEERQTAPVFAPDTMTTEQDAGICHDAGKESKKQFLDPKNINISAGARFYEKAKSRRIRHRDVLRDEASSIFQSAIPLGGDGGTGMNRSIRTGSQTTSKSPRGPNQLANIFMRRHSLEGKEAENLEEERYNQKATMRFMELHEKLNPRPPRRRRAIHKEAPRRKARWSNGRVTRIRLLVLSLESLEERLVDN